MTLLVVVVAAIITILLVVVGTILVAKPALDVLCWAGPLKRVQVEAVVVLVKATVAVLTVDGLLRW